MAASSIGARVRLGMTSPCPIPEEHDRDDHRDREQCRGRHHPAARGERHAAGGLQHPGEDLQRRGPRQAEALKRVQLPVVKDELDQAGEDEDDPGENRHPTGAAVSSDQRIGPGDQAARPSRDAAGARLVAAVP